jgi:NADPH:quinone reductase-like Zn-dependent oxidoreductase
MSSEDNYSAIACTKLYPTFQEAIDNLSVISLARRKLKPTEIRIKVMSTALNFFDLLMMVGKYQAKPKFPFTPASECSGVVVEVGKDVDAFKVGDELICNAPTIVLAEEVVVDAFKTLLLKKPSSFSFAQGSAVFVGFSTAYHGLGMRLCIYFLVAYLFVHTLLVRVNVFMCSYIHVFECAKIVIFWSLLCSH